MNPLLFGASANPPLAREVAESLHLPLGDVWMQRFLDGELHIEIRESVRGRDVYLLQPTSPPADAHLMELLLLADACRRAGARQLTAVIPYFGYARHDRRVSGREPVGARLIADLIQASGIARVVAVDVHTPALEGFFGIPIEHLTAVPILAAELGPVADHAVVVAPDLGAVKLAERYAAILHRPVAIVQKTRLSGESVRAGSVVGEVRGRTPVIVDDMITTAGTVEAAAGALLQAGCERAITVVASHAVLVGPALTRLQSLPITRLVVTDSVVPAAGLPPQARVAGLAPLPADVIGRLHNDQSLDPLLAHA